MNQVSSAKEKILKLVTLAAIALALTGCKTSPSRAPEKYAKGGPFLQAFVASGIVREVKPAEKTVVIQHEEIPGYMAAMTMPFAVKNPQELDGLHPGDKVSFRMIVTANDGWLEQITVTEPAKSSAPDANMPPTNSPVRIVRDVEPLNIGDTLPAYTFTNELEQAVNLAEFRGQALAITFIFTRCPFPTFCPQMTRNFAEAQDKLRSLTEAPTNWHLFSISFDPEHDTPTTLKAYAELYQADPARWNFLTGPLIDITAITEQFGVQFWRANPSEPINHNLRTVVVDALGRVQKILPDNNWTSDELVVEMVKAAAAK